MISSMDQGIALWWPIQVICKENYQNNH